MRDLTPIRRYESELNMKARVRWSAGALLLIAACNRPDSGLFGSDGLAPHQSESGAGGGQTAGGSVASSTGGEASSPTPLGGSAPTAGGSLATPTAGSSNPTDTQNMAGASDAAGASGEPAQPPTPVCGNGALEAGEECDDAAHAGQDGCDANCKVACADFGSGTVESEDHHCYNGYGDADFDGAIQACVKLGAHLATISSAAENKLARGFVNYSKWLGGREDVSATVMGTGTYAWITGESFTFSNWAAREPNQARCLGSFMPCYEHCISMLGDGTWADASCDLPDGYVCEWEPSGTK